ncbi:hypothetical protein LC048_03605 [Mesobacillus subterraneus]|uniref:hypothetical protein n=1 Tax=Mesobacillus subterraneus TaxID=285983 RepID=UPI001CFCC657|nr:hypothetical protein [Mesobacillus subterraneus]WLR56058.1 hypothetical protein LC048_03605 [Mesobacillus subterraneus]
MTSPERTETEKCSRLSRNAETGDSDKEALFASAGGVEVTAFLGGDTRQFEKRRRLLNSDKRWRA